MEEDVRRPDRAELPPRVCVWRVDVGRVLSASADLWSSLSADEQARSARYLQAADRDRFVACRGVLRAVLAAELGLPPEAVLLENDRRGKPRVAAEQDQGDLDFSVSHAGRWGCVAIARGGRVGVDIEWFGRPLRLAGILRKTLTDREMHGYLRTPPAARVPIFLRYWVRKEAIAKATGLGLGLPLDQIEVDPEDADRPLRLPSGMDVRAYHVQEVPMAAGYCGAVAAEADRRPVWECGDWEPMIGLVGTQTRCVIKV